MEYKINQIVYHNAYKFGLVVSVDNTLNEFSVYFPSIKKIIPITSYVIEKYFDDSKVNLLRLVDIFLLNIHECLFTTETINKAYKYANSLTTKLQSIDDYEIKGTSKGHVLYNLTIDFNKVDHTIHFLCSCNHDIYCKHMYALTVISKSYAMLNPVISKISKTTATSIKIYEDKLKQEIAAQKHVEEDNKESFKTYKEYEDYIEIVNTYSKLKTLKEKLIFIKDSFKKLTYPNFLFINKFINQLSDVSKDSELIISYLKVYAPFSEVSFKDIRTQIITESTLKNDRYIRAFNIKKDISAIYGYLNNDYNYLNTLFSTYNRYVSTLSEIDKTVISLTINNIDYITLAKLYKNDDTLDIKSIFNKNNSNLLPIFLNDSSSFLKLFDFVPKITDEQVKNIFIDNNYWNKVIALKYYLEKFKKYLNTPSKLVCYMSSIIINLNYGEKEIALINFYDILNTFPNNRYLKLFLKASINLTNDDYYRI